MKKIAILELKSSDINARLDGNKKIQSNWETFRSEFNHESDAIEEALEN